MKQIDPPLWVAVAQAVKSIRVRLIRQSAAAFGVLLGILFYASVRTGQALSGPATDAESRDAADRLRWLAIVALVMCFVGITNAMLMSVTERYKEIGTLKCLGATNSFIVKVFFMEAAILGGIASFVGAALGIGAMVLVRILTEGTGSLATGALQKSFAVLLSAGGLGLALTIIAAILPAIQAARMPAAAALRVEV